MPSTRPVALAKTLVLVPEKLMEVAGGTTRHEVTILRKTFLLTPTPSRSITDASDNAASVRILRHVIPASLASVIRMTSSS